MADISLTCVACGTRLTVSEFVAGPMPCPQCGALMEKPAKSEASRPHLAAPVKGPLINSIKPMAELLAAQQRNRPKYDWQRVGPGLAVRLTTSWILFVTLLLALLAWQWWGLRDARYLNAYLNARWGLAVIAWLAALIPAFQDTWIQGILCLLVPPYTVYFAFNRLDYFALRAFYFAVVMALAAEFYFLPQQTLVGVVQAHSTEWVETVRAQISKSTPLVHHDGKRDFQGLEKVSQ